MGAYLRMRSIRSLKWGVRSNPPNPPGYGPDVTILHYIILLYLVLYTVYCNYFISSSSSSSPSSSSFSSCIAQHIEGVYRVTLALQFNAAAYSLSAGLKLLLLHKLNYIIIHGIYFNQKLILACQKIRIIY